MTERYYIEPVQIAIHHADRIKEFFDCTPQTLIAWNEAGWFPIKWTGQGRGRKGFVPVRAARLAIEKRAT